MVALCQWNAIAIGNIVASSFGTEFTNIATAGIAHLNMTTGSNRVPRHAPLEELRVCQLQQVAPVLMVMFICKNGRSQNHKKDPSKSLPDHLCGQTSALKFNHLFVKTAWVHGCLT